MIDQLVPHWWAIAAAVYAWAAACIWVISGSQRQLFFILIAIIWPISTPLIQALRERKEKLPEGTDNGKAD